MNEWSVLAVYIAGVSFTVALYRLRPPKWLATLVLGTVRDLKIARPDADEQQVADAVSKTARVGIVILALMWPVYLAAAVIDAPGVAWRRYRSKNH